MFYFLQSTFYFIILFISVNVFGMDHVLKFKYPPQGIKVKHRAMKALERMQVNLRIV